MRVLVKLVLGVLAAIVIALGALIWRIDQGPISLAFAQPLLAWLVDRGSPYAITFEDPVLIWQRQDDELALQVSNTVVRARDGALIASVPSARGTVAVTPLLLQQRLELIEAEIELPEIQLKRDADRNLVLSFAGQLADLPLGAAAEGGGADTLFGPKGEIDDPRLAALRLIRITAPSLQFVDEVTGDRASAADAAFDLKKAGQIWSAAIGGKIGDGRVELTGSPTTTPGRPDLTLVLQQLEPKELQAFAPELPLGGLALPVSGSMHFTIDGATRELGAARIDMTFGAGSIAVTTLGLDPIPVKQGSLRAELDPKWTGGTVERLELVNDAFTLGASGKGAFVDGQLEATVSVDAESLDVGDVLGLWPTEVAGDARAWIAKNVTAGQFTAVRFTVDERGARPAQPDLGASFDFAGATVRYVDTMPPATGVSGKASLAGGSIQFKLAAGRSGEVALGPGSVTINNLIGDAVSWLQVQTSLRSTLPAAMHLLNAEPVALQSKTGLAPDQAAGNQSTSLDLSLPLIDALPPDKVRFTASSTLTDLQLRDVQPGLSLASDRLAVTAAPAAVTAKGDVRLNEVPLTVDFRENTPPVRGVQRTIRAKGTIDAAGARSLKVDWPEDIRGRVGFDAIVTEAANPKRTIDLTLDLRPATIEIRELVITKRPGEPGSASARLVQPDDRTVTIQDAKLDVAGWQAEGEAGLRLDPVRPDRIVVRRLRAPLGDLTTELALEGSRWRGRVDIGRLDLRPVLNVGGGGGGDGELPDFLVQVTARQLRLGDAPFSNLAGMVERRDGIWRTAKLRARIEDSDVSLEVDTPGTTAVILRGSDAGWLIRGFSGSDMGVRGGTFRLSANLAQQPGSVSGSGDLKVRNFTMWGAPMIARIISLASFSGLSNALAGRGVPVTRLVVPFQLHNRSLTLIQAHLVGSDIGARADGTIDLENDRLNITGTVAPAYTVNRIIGRIPIIGQILSGSRSDAALAATFSVSGTASDPQVSVNPLAALVPGMVRDLFSAFTADDSDSDSGR
ncbi:MAG: AsmA-like C-terminal domain-containing protein [Geminicoccaceae bacterium]